MAPKGGREAGQDEDYAKDAKGGVDSCFLGACERKKEEKGRGKTNKDKRVGSWGGSGSWGDGVGDGEGDDSCARRGEGEGERGS